METTEFLNNLKDLIEKSNHPQFNKKEIKIIQNDGVNALAFYLNNVFEENNEQFSHIISINTFFDNDSNDMLIRILNIPLETVYISSNEFEAQCTLNRILLDIPIAINSHSRITRYFEKGEIEIHFFTSALNFYDNGTINEDKFLYTIRDPLFVLNWLYFTLFKIKLSKLVHENILSQVDYEQKIQKILDKTYNWFNWKEDKI